MRRSVWFPHLERKGIEVRFDEQPAVPPAAPSCCEPVTPRSAPLVRGEAHWDLPLGAERSR